jgi:hypothetical protein
MCALSINKLPLDYYPGCFSFLTLPLLQTWSEEWMDIPLDPTLPWKTAPLE